MGMMANRVPTLAVLVLACVLHQASGHGRLLEPPSRASAWRVGFATPANYDDNQLFCGGKENQWNRQGGKCGICGDPYQGPRDHEAGGRFATGTITRTYPEGGTMEITVQLTANHLGWFEFRLCPHNDPSTPATQDCLDRHVLTMVGDGETRTRVDADMRTATMYYELPAGVTCSQCVLQWKYNTGNSWGTDSGQGCLGCGPQEQFYGCSDIAIGDDEQKPSVTATPRPSSSRPQPPSVRPSSPSLPATTRPPVTQPPVRPTDGTRRPSGPCRAIGSYASRPGFHQWCIDNCVRGFCPSNICRCV